MRTLVWDLVWSGNRVDGADSPGLQTFVPSNGGIALGCTSVLMLSKEWAGVVVHIRLIQDADMPTPTTLFPCYLGTRASNLVQPSRRWAYVAASMLTWCPSCRK
jgi:hypothetical protein